MNTTVFLEWFERLCISLPGPSCIVLDNASYHNARTDATTSPTSATRKADMLTWLRNRNIEFENIMTKPELYEIIKRNKPPIIYTTDELALQWGHTVLQAMRVKPNRTRMGSSKALRCKRKYDISYVRRQKASRGRTRIGFISLYSPCLKITGIVSGSRSSSPCSPS